MSLIGLIVLLLLIAIILWAVRTVLGVSGLPEPVRTIVFVLVALLCVLWLVSSLGLLPTGPIIRFR